MIAKILRHLGFEVPAGLGHHWRLLAVLEGPPIKGRRFSRTALSVLLYLVVVAHQIAFAEAATLVNSTWMHHVVTVYICVGPPKAGGWVVWSDWLEPIIPGQGCSPKQHRISITKLDETHWSLHHARCNGYQQLNMWRPTRKKWMVRKNKTFVRWSLR